MTNPTPPRLPIPQGRQLSIRINDGGQVSNVVVGAKGAGSWTDAAAVTAWLQAWANAFAPIMSSAVTIVGATGRDVSSSEGQVYEVGAPATNFNGGAGGDVTIRAASILIRWSTAQGGRSGKGRTFLPGLPRLNTSGDGRTYTPQMTGVVNGAISAYLASTTMSQQGLQPAVLSFRKGAAYPITGGALASVIGVQRRRMR